MTDEITRSADLGQVIDAADGRVSVRFRRVLAAPMDEVWKALTDSEDLEVWLEAGSIEPEEGGTVTVDFDDGPVKGRVTAWDPPRLLEYTWLIEGEPESIVRFELTPSGTDTQLDLEHIGLPRSMGTGYGAGWHAHLDRLADHATGCPVRGWSDRFDAVLDDYRAVTS